MEGKKVTIVLPVYNGENFLSQSIESVLGQTYSNLELIIVNDCSTDSSEEIIFKYKKLDKRIKYVKNDVNSKLPKSLNNGFKLASGDYYTWTSDDNYYHPDAIEKMVCFLDRKPDVGLVYCDYNRITADEKLIQYVSVGESCEIPYKNIVGACFLYRRAVAKTVGEYATDFFLVEDYEYWLRINTQFKVEPYHECLYEYRFHENSLTGKRQKEINKALSKLMWMYLKKYEKLHWDDRNLIKYFEHILDYKPSAFGRRIQMFLFAIRNRTYRIALLKSKMKH